MEIVGAFYTLLWCGDERRIILWDEGGDLIWNEIEELYVHAGWRACVGCDIYEYRWWWVFEYIDTTQSGHLFSINTFLLLKKKTMFFRISVI